MKNGILYISLYVNNNVYQILGTKEVISGKSSLMNFLKIYGYVETTHSHELIKNDTIIQIKASYSNNNRYAITNMDYFKTINKFSEYGNIWEQLLDFYNAWAINLDLGKDDMLYDIDDIIEMLSSKIK